MRFMANYVVLPESSLLVIAAWVIAAWLCDRWDRFPHLAITSPEKRCGKTTLLDILLTIVPRPRYTTNISPAALYRVVEAERPTLLMDESQSISRRGSEASEVIREILNAGIGRNAKVTRCGGLNRDKIEEFSVYGPKVFGQIGDLDGVLADRSLPVPMKRKTKADVVQRYRSRTVDSIGQAIHDKLEQWAGENGDRAAVVYDKLEPFDIDNDRMADLLTPLQAVLTVLEGSEGSEGIFKGGPRTGTPLETLRGYAEGLDERDREQETQTPGVRLLAACREIFGTFKEPPTGGSKWLGTDQLISVLVQREEEPWHRWNKGQPITRETLANLLRPYGIRSAFNKERTGKGYYAYNFGEAWNRYLPLEIPSNPSNPSNPSPSAKPSLLAKPLADRQKGGER